MALVATGCTGDLPASVEKGSEVTVAWPEYLTSTNPASAASLTDGNLDIASLTRGGFGTMVGDTVEMDETFGKVKLEGDKQDRVRYDLAKPNWSDGVPIDTADLMLAWAASSGYFSTPKEGNSHDPIEFGATPTGLTKSSYIPKIDEGGRAIEVPLVKPIVDWRTALDVAVPAHVVGQKALKIDDPIEAKEVVETAIEESDTAKLTKIAKAWSTEFAIAKDGKASEEKLLSSGPYRVSKVAAGDGGQEVDLEANPEYAGEAKPTYEKVRLTPTSSAEALDSLGDKVDVVQVSPTKGNRTQVRDLERRDYGVANGNDGTMWALVLRADRGVFKKKNLRTAYLRTVPRGDVSQGGAGNWSEAYEATDIVLFPPGGEGYQIATEDSGFSTKFGASGNDKAAHGSACVSYDKSNAYASGAYAALSNAVDDEGWNTTDCGVPSADKVMTGNRWNAALVQIPIPQTPDDIADQWGSKGSKNATGIGDSERDRLIDELARTADPYAARDVRVKIEKTLVKDSIVVPIAMNPTVTVADKKVDNVRPRSGLVAPLLSTVVEWSPAKK